MQFFGPRPDIYEGALLSRDSRIEAVAVPGDNQTKSSITSENKADCNGFARREVNETRQHLLIEEPDFSTDIRRERPDRQIRREVDRVTD